MQDSLLKRSTVDAVLVGIGTVIADDPMLSVRHVKDKLRQPLRIIVDSKLRIPLTSKVLDVSTGQQTMVVTTRQSPAAKLKELENLGISTVIAGTVEPLMSQGLQGTIKIPLNPPLSKGGNRFLPLEKGGKGGFERLFSSEEGRVSLKLLMTILGKSGITSILIEGGSEINASALREGIVDKVVLIYSARIIGGRDSIGIVGGHSPKSLDESVFLKDIRVKRLDQDIMVEGYIIN